MLSRIASDKCVAFDIALNFSEVQFVEAGRDQSFLKSSGASNDEDGFHIVAVGSG